MNEDDSYRILVTGSRDWKNPFTVAKAIQDYWDEVLYHSWSWPGDLVIVHGDCPTGADYWADLWAKTYKHETDPHPADWDQFGKYAGPKRNKEMVDSRPNAVLGFLRPESRGTKQCLNYAKEQGLYPIKVYNEDD